MSTISPNTNSCTIQPTSDQQLNYNLAEFVKILIASLQDGTIAVKNTERIQNLTIEDIVNLAKQAIPNQDINNYITENGTNIIEMIDSYNIIKDTKFVNSNFIPFKIISRTENDPTDPTGITKIQVPYIQAKLPYDIINKDRIVQIYITTKDDNNINTIENDVIFEYTLDIDPTDPKAAYIMEARAQKIQLGKSEVYDVSTHPMNKTWWGTWSKEKYIIVSYLVDSNWIPDPGLNLPDSTHPKVAKTTSSNIIPMNYGLNNISLDDKPTESINIINEHTKVINIDKTNLLYTPSTEIVNESSLMVIEDPAVATTFNSFLNWFKDAKNIIEQKSSKLIFSSDGINNEFTNILVMPNNKIINQATYNLMGKSFLSWGASVGLSDKIIEQITAHPIEIKVSSKFEPSGTITSEETSYSLMLKFRAGEQYNFINIEKYYLPARIIGIITSDLYASAYSLNQYFPARIIEEIKTYLNPLRFDKMVVVSHVPTRIINWLGSMDIIPNKTFKRLNFPARIIENTGGMVSKINDKRGNIYKPNLIQMGSRIIEEIDYTISNIKNGAPENIEMELLPYCSRIIEEDEPDQILYEQILSLTRLNLPVHIINQIDIGLTDPISIFNKLREFGPINSEFNPESLSLNKLFIFNPSRVISQESLYPMKMEVSSGSVNYIQDLHNIRVITSLNKLEMVPLITAEGRQQRSEYEFISEQDQRVFTVEHNPDLVTVFRQGFKLSHGDYYSNGYKIILKSPANAGEVINIVSERKYVFSNTVTKEELNNAIMQMRMDRPIITYPGIGYEKSSAEIKINNYNPNATYTVSIKYDGKYRDDIPWIKRNDTIIIDLPEVKLVTKRTISIIIWAGISGRLQSQPTEANIIIKNLYDTEDNPYRLIFGAVPTDWYGMENTKFTFDEMKTSGSTYADLTPLNEPIPLPSRIGINKNNWYQSKLVSIDKFKGTFLETSIGLENLPNRCLQIINSNGSETTFSCDRTQKEIEDAFEKGTLYFIVDSSTIPNINVGYSTHKYSYKPAIEYTSSLNLLPLTEADIESKTAATWYLEHNNKLLNRIIRNAIILDFDLIADYDFDGQAVISEDNNLSIRKIPMESIEYKVQDEIPHLVVKINDPNIPNITNPYINIGSKINIETGNQILDNLQQESLLVNNLYAERIFSGNSLSLISKDNFMDTQAIMNISKRYKKFSLYSPGGIFDTHFKKDIFMLNEEDFSDNNAQNKSIISMIRFFSDTNIVVDNPSYSARVKELAKINAIPESFKALYSIPEELFSSGSEYQSNFGHVQYGGVADYIIDTEGSVANIIEQKITFQKIYIKNADDIKSGSVPQSSALVTDGYHVIVKDAITKRIPTWWDVVLRPSVRASRAESLRDVWELIRNNIGMTDSAWLNLTDGILRKPKSLIQENLSAGIHKDYDVCTIHDQSQIFLFGGEGYIPTKVRKTAITVNQDYIDEITANDLYYAAKLKTAFNKRYSRQGRYKSATITLPNGTTQATQVWVDEGGWKEKTDIIDISYGWENGEPYVEYAWADHFYWRDRTSEYSDLKFYVDRISRTRVINKDIYHLELSTIDKYNPSDNDIFPKFITKIISSDYREIFNHPDKTNVGTITKFADTIADDRPNFMDIQFESGAYWITIKPAYTNQTKLYKMKLSYTNYAAIAGGIQIEAFKWSEIKNLHTDFDNKIIDTNFSRWTLLPDITSTLRGDGPLLIKHCEKAPYAGSSTATIDPGIYTYDTWDKHLYKKSDTIIPPTSILFGISEISGIRNPYILQLDYTGIENKIDIVGSRIYVIIYLDKYISKLTLEQFYLFKEEILHIDKGTSTLTENKSISVLNNANKIGIRTILPDGDDYHSTSAQILMDTVTTQTGRQATSLVFRITNKDTKVLEIDSIRFQSV